MENSLLAILKKELPFWNHLTESDQNVMLARCSIVNYTAGQNVHGSETDCLGVLVLLSGSMRVYLASEEGKDVTVYKLKKGDTCVLAAGCILQGITFEVQIDAEEDSQVVLIPAELFAELSARNIYVENFSYKHAVERFSDMINAVQRMLFLSLEQRLAAYLIDESSQQKSDEIHQTHEKIARAIGSAREAVSRSLKNMAAQGSIELFRGGVRILSKQQLYNLLA